MSMDSLNQLRIDLLKDFILFTRFFFHERTNRDFIIGKPISNEPHFFTMARELTDCFMLKNTRLAINCPPGWSKSEILKLFICWAMAHYPDSRFLYISYSHELAASHTADIKSIISLPIYRKLFNVIIPRDSSAKDFFKTTVGGTVAAFGSSGGITGRDGGLPGLDRFSGCVCLDDVHKPDEVHSDTVREKIIRNYQETIERRPRGINVPIVVVGQRLHQNDIFGYILSGKDGRKWRHVKIKGLDDAGNARYPEVNPKEELLDMQKYKPYVFASQFQQDPIPAGGALFKPENFPLLDYTPEIIATFVTGDTAETEDEYNDPSVFSFWGYYQIKFKGEPVPDLFGLHWINCIQEWVEPKDLEDLFMDFYTGCMRYHVKPQFAAIEKKSTGVTLLSVLKDVPGLKTIDIERTKLSNSKSDRFIAMQQYINKKQVSLPKDGKHTEMVLKHMSEITANNSHKHDDIADTCYDGIRFAFIDKIIQTKLATVSNDYSSMAKNMMQGNARVDFLRKKAYGSGR